MEGNMDVLPFSLSCDRCDFRTKSMSAMRDHAQTHSAEHQDQHPIEEIGISNHAPSDDHALQALVDSALNDASRLLLSSPDNSNHHHLQDPGTTSNQSPVEEVGRTDGNGHPSGVEHQDRKKERMVTPRASALAAEDLLGIYAAGIDFSVVGGGVVHDGQFRAGCGQEVQTMMSAAIAESADGGVRSGMGIPSHDEATSRSHLGDDGSGSMNNGGETEPYSVDSSGNSRGVGHDSNTRVDPNQRKENSEISCGIHPITSEQARTDSPQSRSSGSASCSQNLGRTQMLRGKKATRPSFKFVIHRSAFSKTPSADDETPSSSSKHRPSHSHSKVVARQAKDHNSSASDNASATMDKGSGGTTASRTRGQRSKLVLEDGGTAARDASSGRRRGRKLVCPTKLIVEQGRTLPPSKRHGQKGFRPGARPGKGDGKKMRYRCPECHFSCMLKKDLTAHTKLAHTKSGRKDARVGKVHFEINKSKASQSKQGSKRTSRGNVLDSCDTEQEDSPPNPRKLLKRVNDNRKSTSRCNKRPTREKKPAEDESEELQENDDEENVDDDWEPDAGDVSSSEGEVIDSGREEDSDDDDVCSICHKFTADCPADMERHRAEEHRDSLQSSKQFQCNYCSYSCQGRKTLAAHIHGLHGDTVQLLTQKATEPKAKSVKKEVDTSRVYRCSICNFSCHSSHLLNSHMKSTHHFEKMSGEFTCGVCGKVVVGRYSHFRRHLRCHSEERPYKCDQCPLAFRDANSLNCHLPIHKEDRDYLCEDCGMAFKRPINLRMHRKVHSDKMFPCDACDYKCRRRNTLLNHKKRKHLKQKTVLCQHCGHCFFSKTECKNHVMKKHTQRPTPFACPICPAVFMFQYRFKAHLKTHPEIKPYRCHVCGFETRLNTYLMDHMRQHTGEKPKKCNLCDYETSTNSNLYKHRKRHHGPGIPRLSSRTRRPRPNRAQNKAEENPMGMSDEQKQRAEKSVVEDIVNAVEFGQMASQVNLAAGGQAAAAMFNMAAMCSTQEFKQEQLMQVPPSDVHQGHPILPEEVNIISSVSDTGHDAERLSISILDKTTSSVAAMMEALADARNMRPPQAHQPNHQALISHPSPYSIHLATAPTPQPSTPPTTSSAPLFQRSVAAMAANMTMHYVHPNIGAIGGGGSYHHLSALAGEAASRSPITSHGQPTPHNVTIPPPLIGVGQGQATPQPLTHFPNMMHY